MRQPDFTRRVVVTGLGVISPVGNDKDTAWASLVNGRSGLDVITKFDPDRYTHKWAGEVKDFDAVAWMDAKAVRRSEPTMWYPNCSSVSPSCRSTSVLMYCGQASRQQPQLMHSESG